MFQNVNVTAFTIAATGGINGDGGARYIFIYAEQMFAVFI